MMSLDIINCPVCGKKTFIKLLYKGSKGFVDKNIGYCKRGKFCTYNSISIDKINYQDIFTYTIPGFIVEDSMNNEYKKTNFARFLYYHLKNAAWNLLEKYYVGHFFQGDKFENVFWRIDNNLAVRSGIYSLYDKDKGFRIHSSSIELICDDEFRVALFSSCFFGAHLINYFPQKDIAIVEDEKTAIVCSYFWPEYNWLATGDIDLLYWHEYSIYNILINKQVVIFTEHEYPLINSKLSLSVCQEIVEYLSNEIPCNIKILSLFLDKIQKLDLDSQDLIRALLNYPYEF